MKIVLTCFECDGPAKHAHHVVPKSKGGIRTISLCEKCHGLVHGRDFLHHIMLTKAGLERSRLMGTKLGGKPLTDKQTIIRISVLRMQGLSLRKISDALTAEGNSTMLGKKWHASTVRNVLNRAKASGVLEK